MDLSPLSWWYADAKIGIRLLQVRISPAMVRVQMGVKNFGQLLRTQVMCEHRLELIDMGDMARINHCGCVPEHQQ